jgi:hypothetical protein
VEMAEAVVAANEGKGAARLRCVERRLGLGEVRPRPVRVRLYVRVISACPHPPRICRSRNLRTELTERAQVGLRAGVQCDSFLAAGR